MLQKKNIKTPTAGVKRDETPLFLATMWKIPDMVEKILKSYPQAAEHINEKGRNILHVAIQYRQMKIFKKVMEDEMLTRRLLRATDTKGNSMLHMVAKNRKGLEEKTSQGPAFELQEQLLLFEKVKGLVKSDFVRLFNRKNQTAEELLVDNYSKLHEESKEWTKRTSENCSIVGVLIATVAFAAAYTVPGGNQSTGIPVLLSQPFFVVFTLADIISLTLALTSVVTFLSILTSPFRLEDFKHSLIQKLMMGFTFLILSVTMMMVAFGATIILTIHNKENWTQIALYSVAFLPVIIFAVTYSPLYVQLVKACRHFWKFMKKIVPDPCGSSSSLPPNESLSTIYSDPPQSRASCSRRPSTSQTTNVEV
ncbi:ankyrin repeat-containing protein ITN1-like isoform X1 [Vitis riparia]|uniref:ankyrin repeat-containing protein ITN1-like isoform X1 n=1 Tax=Vitis riparia TaxID=96939 RepID=UPI00155A16E0|nr:ankyrin repeat-containing protein ITN1-like isoform X1 [Vitis riparia]XP_034711651.1 ankyrin repeat-containing protein ITN1-like isoform X1 [Vitis riparia]